MSQHGASTDRGGDWGPSLPIPSPLPSPFSYDDDSSSSSRDGHRQASGNGRLLSTSQTFPTPPAMSSRPPRFSRPNIPSPLSTPNNNVTFSASFAKPTSPGLNIIAGTKQQHPSDLPLRDRTTPTPTRGMTFYTDSSNPSSPIDENPRITPLPSLNDFRNIAQPGNFRHAQGSNQESTSAMASPATAAGRDGSAVATLARKSSLDSAISAVTSSMQAHGPSNTEQRSQEIAKLIRTAGSAEAAIQHLLKEKQSQSQQNSQLWRLVDKQRAMILGLNKDLETALRDKERYKRKVKEITANQTSVKAPNGEITGKHDDDDDPDTPDPQHMELSEEPSVALPDSPTLDVESRKASPIDMALTPYPITPPADRMHGSISVVTGPLRSMSEGEHFNALDRASGDRVFGKALGNENMEGLILDSRLVSSPPPLSSSSPSKPSRRLPSLASKPPSGQSTPIVNVVEPTPQPNEGRDKFLSPSRKGPPAPLQLKQERPPHLDTIAVADDTDSEYDDLGLAVGQSAHEGRGRRRTREEDDKVRQVSALREAEARSASKNSKSSKSTKSSKSRPPNSEPPPDLPAMPTIISPDATTSASLSAVLRGGSTHELVPTFISPGLPVSPRPFGNPKMMLGGSLTVPQGAAAAGAVAAPPPLSPRPPRQPIPLPSNTPLSPLPPLRKIPSIDGVSPGRPANVARRMAEASQYSGHTKSQSGPVGRTKIYKGLVTEEYPDLLLSPNALPSIDVKVASSRMRLPRSSLMTLTQLEEDPVFTLAVLSRADNGELWRVEKDSASLMRLDQRLKMCPIFTAKTPDRSLFSGHSPAKLDARRWALDQYMDELLNTALDTSTAVELCRYLSTNTLPPNAEEMGSANFPPGDPAHKNVENRPFQTGYLTKKGKNFGGWKARFFVLDGLQLRYYESPGGTHLGTIRLQNAQIGKQSQGHEGQSPTHHANDEELDDQYRHAFLILEQKKKDSNHLVKHVLCAESDVERDSWVEALFKCIDHLDQTEELQLKLSSQDHQAQGQSSTGGSKSSKKGAPGRTHSSGLDTLIGVRYDSTHAGETPQGAPSSSRPRTAGGPPESQPSSAGGDSQPKVISGPRDPQIISDSTTWGNKVVPTISHPSHDEKKQRKRSFFGFGAKARNSSEGQEGMFGGSESGVSPTPQQNAFQSPVRPVFGAPLAEAVRYNAPQDVRVPVPSVVYRCIQYLESQNAIFEEGIFRLSGSNVVIKQLRERFNTEGDVNLVTDEQYYDIHAVASLLKLYLRELPTSILTRDLHLEFLATIEMADRERKLASLKVLVLRLPQANATLLKYLIAFLIRIINKADVNKMTVRNVGIVFSPTLHIPAPVFAILLQNYEAIFGIDPEEYELPSPVSESEGASSQFASTPRFEIPGRPSTSSGSASPHAQGWVESVGDASRSTPTPPLLMSLNVARGSPTLRGTPRQMYETSSYVTQSPRAAAAAAAAAATSQAIADCESPSHNSGTQLGQGAHCESDAASPSLLAED